MNCVGHFRSANCCSSPDPYIQYLNFTNTCLRINSLSWLQLLVLTQVLCIAQAITNATVQFVQQWSAHGLVCSNGPKHLQFGINLKHQPHNRAGRGDPNLMLLGGTCWESLLVYKYNIILYSIIYLCESTAYIFDLPKNPTTVDPSQHSSP